MKTENIKPSEELRNAARIAEADTTGQPFWDDVARRAEIRNAAKKSNVMPRQMVENK